MSYQTGFSRPRGDYWANRHPNRSKAVRGYPTSVSAPLGDGRWFCAKREGRRLIINDMIVVSDVDLRCIVSVLTEFLEAFQQDSEVPA